MNAPVRSRPVAAVVQTGECECPYVRVGSGERVLLLLPTLRDAWLDGPIAQRLAERYCVVVPVVPRAAGARTRAASVPFEEWVIRFLDGTGLDRCTVVAEADLVPALDRFARADDRIERLVFVNDADCTQSADTLLALLSAGTPEPDPARGDGD